MLQIILKALKIVPPTFKKKLVYLQVVLAVSAILELVGVVSVGPFIALAVNPAHVHDNPYLSSVYKLLNMNSDAQFLLFAGVVFGLLFVGSNMMLLATQVYLNKVSGQLQAVMADRLYRYFLSQNYLYHIKHRPGTLISKISNDTLRLSNGIVLAFLQINSRLFSIAILIVLLFVVNYMAALTVGVAVLGAYVGVYWYANTHLKANGKDRTYNDRYRSKMLQETFESIKTLLFYNLQGSYSQKLGKSFVERTRIGVSDKLLQDMPYFFIESVAFIMIIGVIFYVFSNSSEPATAIAQLSVICLAGYRLIPKFQQVYRSVASIKASQHPLNQLYDDLRAANKAYDSTNEPVIPYYRLDKGGRFELQGIGFSYADGSPVFESVNFYVDPGEVVGITGESGVGKSTLMAIMTAMLPSSQGTMLYGGKKITEELHDAWRQFIGYVDSDTYLFEGSILDNILLGREFNDSKLGEVLDMCQIDLFLGALDLELTSDVGTKGARLSSGQRQRIGFARALYGDPTILFMDEATNALDYGTQQRLMDRIKVKSSGISMVVISHRLDMKGNFDRVYNASAWSSMASLGQQVEC